MKHDMTQAGYDKRKRDLEDWGLVHLAQMLTKYNDTGVLLTVKHGMLYAPGCNDYCGCEYADLSDLFELTDVDREPS